MKDTPVLTNEILTRLEYYSTYNMHTPISIHESKNINIFSNILYKICTYFIRFSYKFLEKIIPSHLEEKSEKILHIITTENQELNILEKNDTPVKMSLYIKYMICILDVVILFFVLILILVISYFAIIYNFF